MKLSQQEIDSISALVELQKITITTLKDDLLDHLCCVTERKMSEGKSFEMAIHDALTDLAPSGLTAIEAETILLLDQKTYVMKKVTFFIGTICVFGIALGCVLALLKFPMGHMIFGLAAFSFVIFFLPIDAIRYLRSTSDRWPEKLRYLCNMSSTIILATGVLSRLMMLPGADEMIIFGLALFLAGFLPLQIFKMFRESFSS